MISWLWISEWRVAFVSTVSLRLLFPSLYSTETTCFSMSCVRLCYKVAEGVQAALESVLERKLVEAVRDFLDAFLDAFIEERFAW